MNPARERLLRRAPQREPRVPRGLGGGVPVARRYSMADPRRLATTVLGVGTSLALILLLWGLWGGLGGQASAYEDNVGADLFVAEAGTRTVAGDTSVLPLGSIAAVQGVPGVDGVHPVVFRYTVLELHDRKLFARLVGSEPGRLGGPWQLLEGRAADGPGEAVLDLGLAREHGLEVGDRLQVLGAPLEVVGLSGGTRSWMVSFLFVTHATAAELLRTPQSTSLLLVQAQEPATAAARIEADLGLAVLTPEDVAANNRELLTGVMAAPVLLMIAVAFAAGTMVTSLSVYSAVVERIREYGVVKALGATPRRLLRIVVGQTLVVTFLGGAASYAIYRFAAWGVVAARPQFAVELAPGALAAVLAAAVAMALVGALVPLARVVRLDPAAVYRG
jgi:putative ABC transport system permease protein